MSRLQNVFMKDNDSFIILELYEINLSFLRYLYEVTESECKYVNIILYIQRGSAHDKLVKKYIDSNPIFKSFTIIRSSDELFFTLGSLCSRNNKVIYASHFKNAISSSIFPLINNDNMAKLYHLRLNGFLKINRKEHLIRLIQQILPQSIDLKAQTFNSKPIGTQRTKMTEKSKSRSSGSSIASYTTADSLTKSSSSRGKNKEIQNLGQGPSSKANQARQNEKEKGLDVIQEEPNQDGFGESEENKHSDKNQKVIKYNKEDKPKKAPKKNWKTISKKSPDSNEKISDIISEPSTDFSSHKDKEESKFGDYNSTPNLSNIGEYTVDPKGCLVINGFNHTQNVKYTNHLSEFFKKIASCFKSKQSVEVITQIKRTYQLFTQHFSKYFKNDQDFNEVSTRKLFSQIMNYMHDKKYIQGKILSLFIKQALEGMYNLEEDSMTMVHCDKLNELSEKYEVKAFNSKTKSDHNMIHLSKESQADLTLKIVEQVLSEILRISGSFPKTKNNFLKKINGTIRNFSNVKDIDPDYKLTWDRNHGIKFWVLDMLQEFGMVEFSEKDESIVNPDRMQEFMMNLKKDHENWKYDAIKLDIYG